MADAYFVLGSRRVSVRLPRLFSILVAVWAIRHVAAIFEIPEQVRALWGAAAVVWVLAAVYLFLGRHVRIVCWLVLALIGLEFIAVGLLHREGLSMLAWLTLIMALTEGHETERALLIRVCATVVYAFSAISKLNPSWLGGDGVRALPAVHPPLEFMSGPLEAPLAATAAAVSVILVELLLPAGLWSRRYRAYAAALGIVVHFLFVATLARSLFSFLHLILLNGGLVLCYVAFWEPIRSESNAEGAEIGEGLETMRQESGTVRSDPSSPATHLPLLESRLDHRAGGMAFDRERGGVL